MLKPENGDYLQDRGEGGDRKRAIRAYVHYLRMHEDAEPSLVPQVDSVKRELAQLRSGSR